MSDIISLKVQDILILPMQCENNYLDLYKNNQHIASSHYNGELCVIDKIINTKENEITLQQWHSKLEFNVRFELGQLNMHLEKLLKLTKGDCIELKKPLNSYVDIIIDNNKCGTGKLVEINKRLGIQVIKIDKKIIL